MATVGPGQDYTTLNGALVAAEATITIPVAFTDTTAATVGADCTITATGAGRHAGFADVGNHYTLSVSAGHCLTINGAYTVTVDGLAIRQNGTGTSDEGIRCVPGTADSVTIKECLIWAANNTTQQDGVYTGFNISVGTVNVIQTTIWNFGRAGIHSQNNLGDSGVVTINVNSCFVYNNGRQASNSNDGGLSLDGSGTAGNVTWNVHNTAILGNSPGSANDIYKAGTGSTLNISYSIDSDNTISTTANSGTGNLASRTITDNTSPGAGAWVIVEDITTIIDLRLVSNAENDAENAHATATAHGITIPSTDLVGTSRPQDTNYDIGPFEISGTLTHTYSASGGAQTAGAATTSLVPSGVFSYSASGGAQTAGAVTVSRTRIYVPSGGFSSGGAATTLSPTGNAFYDLLAAASTWAWTRIGPDTTAQPNRMDSAPDLAALTREFFAKDGASSTAPFADDSAVVSNCQTMMTHMDTWNGAAVGMINGVPKHWSWGVGHADGARNQVIQMDLDEAATRIDEATGEGLFKAITDQNPLHGSSSGDYPARGTTDSFYYWPTQSGQENLQSVGSKGPPSGHSYDYLTYDKSRNVLWVISVATFQASGTHSGIWYLDFDTGEWVIHDTQSPTGASNGGGMLMIPDGSQPGYLFWKGGGESAGVIRYDIANKTFSTAAIFFSGSGTSANAPGFLIPSRAGGGEWDYVTVATSGSNLTIYPEIIAGSSNQSYAVSTYSGDTRAFTGSWGFRYRPEDGLVYAISSTGQVQTLSFSGSPGSVTCTVADVTTTGGNSLTQTNGVNGKVNYLPELDCFTLIVGDTEADVFVAKPSSWAPVVSTTYSYSASGGAQTAGAATVSRTLVPVASGGAQTAGAATTSVVPATLTHTYSASGGAQTAGAATVSRTLVPVASGGAQTAGAATVSRTLVPVASGGAQTAGAATTEVVSGTVTHTYTATGGAQLSGTSLWNTLRVYSVSGGGQTAGAAAFARTIVQVPSGGMQTAGAATTSTNLSYSYTAGGGFLLGGASSVWYITVAAGGSENLSPDAVISSTVLNVSGGISVIQDDPDTPDANWFTNAGSDGTLRISFPTPSGNPQSGAGVQEFRVRLRKNATGGGTPNFSAQLRETGGGTALESLALLVPVNTANPGTVFSLPWNADNLATADGSAVELMFFFESNGGGPNARHVEVGAAEWVVALGAAAFARYSYVPVGGMEFSGTATTSVIRTFTYSATGGAQTAGAATLARTQVQVPSGGLSTAGAATLARTQVQVPSGGLSTAGTAAFARTIVQVASGGMQTAGAAATEVAVATLTHTYSASGGAQTAGAATLSRTIVQVASGGAQTAGAATLARTLVPVASGGAQTAGAATTQVAVAHSYSSSGGAQTAGAATLSRTLVPVASGGAQTAGAATLSRTLVPGVSGGLQTAGAATTVLVVPGVFEYSASGGAQTAGAATVSRTLVPVASGGAQTAGAATLARIQVQVPSGGLSTAGTAATSRVYASTSSGGLLAAGAATLARAFVAALAGGGLQAAGAATTSTFSPGFFSYVATGGLQSAGTASLQRTFAPSPSGGVVAAGSSQQSLTRIYVPTGGASTGGAAATEYFNAGVEYTASGGMVAAGGLLSVQLVRNAAVSGGVVSSGEAGRSYSRGYVVSPFGPSLGGSAGVSFARTAPVDVGAGIQLTGFANTTKVFVGQYVPSGGFIASGIGQIVRIKIAILDAGTVVLGGEAFTERQVFLEFLIPPRKVDLLGPQNTVTVLGPQNRVVKTTSSRVVLKEVHTRTIID